VPAFRPAGLPRGASDADVFRQRVEHSGARELLHGVAELAPAPRPQHALGATGPRPISPEEPRVAGFVVKMPGAGDWIRSDDNENRTPGAVPKCPA
jgi:hypothetical protein